MLRQIRLQCMTGRRCSDQPGPASDFASQGFYLNYTLRDLLLAKYADSLSLLPASLKGTKLGPILFLVMVNNLNTSQPDVTIQKFVDDISLSEEPSIAPT